MALQQVVKWGNSLALRIPAAIAKHMQVQAGGKVEIRLEGKRLVVVAAADELPRFTQADLVRALKGAKKRRDHLGRPRGREIL